MDARNMQRREINKYIKQNCAPSWIYLQNYTGMHGQQNIKFRLKMYIWMHKKFGKMIEDMACQYYSSQHGDGDNS